MPRNSTNSPVQQDATSRNNISSARDSIGRFLRARNELSEKQRNAVALLLHGMSDEDVAGRIGVDRTTIYRWRQGLAFQRELDRQRRAMWEQSAGAIQSLVGPALDILRKQLAGDDPRLAMRAAGMLLRFATPSRLLGSTGAGAAPVDEEEQFGDDLLAYINAPLPGQPGAPEDLPDEDEDDEEEE